jgi:hypothetical protein
MPAPYIKEAVKGHPVNYPKLIHVTCGAHVLHRICETICVLYPNVDKLVANGKKIFVKSPARIQLFRNKAPDTSLPPTPVITHWEPGRMLLFFCAENFWNICSVQNKIDRDDVSSISILQDICKGSNEFKVLKTDLAYIHANFSFLSQFITKLEKTTNFLSETIKEINDI